MKDRYHKCGELFKKLGEYYGIRDDDEKMQDSSKFFTFWVTYFDAIDKHWPKEKKNKTGGGKTSYAQKHGHGAKVSQKPMRMLPLE